MRVNIVCVAPRFSFVKLNEMESLEPNTKLDVIAVVKNVEDYATIMTRWVGSF